MWFKGETLTGAPRGYPKDHERIALLRRKGVALGATLRFARCISRDNGIRFVTNAWRAATPVTTWHDAHVGATTIPANDPQHRR